MLLIFEAIIKPRILIMEPNTIMISFHPLQITCKTFQENHIDGTGVVEKGGSLCGILSKTDITRPVASMN